MLQYLAWVYLLNRYQNGIRHPPIFGRLAKKPDHSLMNRYVIIYLHTLHYTAQHCTYIYYNAGKPMTRGSFAFPLYMPVYIVLGAKLSITRSA